MVIKLANSLIHFLLILSFYSIARAEGFDSSMPPMSPTGVTTWSDGTSYGLKTPQGAYPRQDADTAQGTFSFTKVDVSTGAVLPYSAPAWGCVRDNNTGLTWEVKTSDGGLHDRSWLYGWKDYSGEPGSSPECGGTGCVTEIFINSVNSTGWCGFKDWRVPTIDEMLTIVNYAPLGPYTATIDLNYFPDATASYDYWTSTHSTTYSREFSFIGRLTVRFYQGLIGGRQGGTSYVRLVRGKYIRIQ